MDGNKQLFLTFLLSNLVSATSANGWKANGVPNLKLDPLPSQLNSPDLEVNPSTSGDNHAELIFTEPDKGWRLGKQQYSF